MSDFLVITRENGDFEIITDPRRIRAIRLIREAIREQNAAGHRY